MIAASLVEVDEHPAELYPDILARAMGVKLMTPSFYEVLGIADVTSPANDSVLAQYRLTYYNMPLPPTTNMAPAADNNVHHDMNFLDAAHLQPAPFARAAARIEVRAWERVGVFVAAACDARFVINRYMIDHGGVTQVMYEPQRFRPWVVVGLDAVLGDGGNP